ncbi:MAG TPA: crosslink repair DNA glycosylase YcaQ family protein, partial [Pilimelia sp.]|nr:crosslink repair DNA glycosylase YcaQ family protein [Pilimelia sp.]
MASRGGGARAAFTRAQVLAYRAAAHELEAGVDRPGRCAVLAVGVRDTGPRRLSRLALRARVVPGAMTASADPLADPDLTLVHSVRGAMHLHRGADLPMVRLAVRLRDAADTTPASFGPFAGELAAAGGALGDALDEVSAAMRAVMADGRARTKGELSGEVTPRLDRRLCPWCEGCGVFHPQDALFRYATLQAGLCLDADQRFTRSPYLDAVAAHADGSVDAARRELARRFLHLCGPATHHRLAAWLAIPPAAARRLLDAIDDVVDVTVDGRRGWMVAPDLDAVATAPPPVAVRLLPAYDPLTEIADRELLVPDSA